MASSNSNSVADVEKIDSSIFDEVCKRSAIINGAQKDTALKYLQLAEKRMLSDTFKNRIIKLREEIMEKYHPLDLGNMY